MKELTKKNHFKYYYNGESFTFRNSPEDLWTVSFDDCKHPPSDFKTECLNAAEYIANSTSLPIIVMFSGGIDSEIIVRSFHEVGADVRAVTMRIENDLNYHDFKYAVDLCKELSIPHTLYTLDIFDFFENKMLNYLYKVAPIYPLYCATAWLADQVEGYIINGNGVPHIIEDDGELYMAQKEPALVNMRYYILKDISGAPEFFHYTPELIASYSLEVMEAVKSLPEEKVSSYVKYDIYKKFWPDLAPRKKYMGFEKLIWFNIIYAQKLYDIYQNMGIHLIPLSRFKEGK